MHRNRARSTATAPLIASLLALAGLVHGGTAQAQAWPSKPIRVVIPYTAGGPTGEIARAIMFKVNAVIGQSAVIDPRPGAGGTIGTNIVAKAPPDGHTLLYSTAGNLLQAPFMVKDVPFHPLRDFTPVTGVVKTVGVLAVNPAVPVRSVREMIDYSRRNPGKFSISNSGVGAAYYMGVELINKLAGVQIVNVPYKGTESYTAAASGEVSGVIGAITSLKQMEQSGRVRSLAVIESTRFAGLPHLPTIGETIPGFALPVGFHGFLGPAGLPQPIVKRLHGEVVAALKAPEVIKVLEGYSLDVAVSDPEQFAANLKADYELFARVVKLLDIKPE